VKAGATAAVTGRDAHPARRRDQAARTPPPDTHSPADRYQELFVAVQQGRVFPDSKTFVDCAPRIEPPRILDAYRAHKDLPGFVLRDFVLAHFSLPAPADSGYRSVDGQGLREHIDGLWPFLTRRPEGHPRRGSMLQLPHAYVVPGGRFAEMYYWDSYFTMLGLVESGLAPLVHDMTDNFGYLLDTYGHVPNGTRTYYLSRSQPPVFALMTRLCEQRGGQPAVEYLPQLKREHAFWMDGADRLRAEGDAHRRVARGPGGVLLNRYWDDRDTPR
jgi:alpha,alpha-trehalase